MYAKQGYLASVFIYIYTLSKQAAKAYPTLRIWADLLKAAYSVTMNIFPKNFFFFFNHL